MEQKKTAIVLGGVQNHIHLINRLKERGFYTILVDYLENHMGNKLEDLEHSIKRLEDVENPFKQEAGKDFKESVLQNRSDQAELEELLREFLA